MNVNADFDAAPEVLTVKEAAGLLRVSPDTVYLAVRQGQLRAAKLRGRVLLTKTDLRAFLKGTPIRPPRPAG